MTSELGGHAASDSTEKVQLSGLSDEVLMTLSDCSMQYILIYNNKGTIIATMVHPEVSHLVQQS